MNEKKSFIIICSIMLLFITVCTGCRSVPEATVVDTVAANSYAIGAVSSTVEGLTTIIDSSTDRITDCSNRAAEITDGVERAIYLFGEYEQITNRLLEQITAERDKAQELLDSYNSLGDTGTISTDSEYSNNCPSN